ncbi:MAG: hypothetical protein OWR62_12055 [Sulfobacillus thermotolerans]|nr:hypothetical protein [Sulfobacillus thermotolerans]
MDLASETPFPCAGDGPNFYIGRLGKGLSANMDYFNVNTAKAVGKAHTFAVWVLEGPGSRPSGDDPEYWGFLQGNTFMSAWSENQDLVGGQTLFADIEPGSGGWTLGNYDENTATLFGFLNVVTSGNSGNQTGGVYISQDYWNGYFGSNYVSQIPIVVWAAGSNCPDGCVAAADEFNASYANMVIGGYYVSIWQYYPTACGGNRDLDITPHAGYQTSKWEPLPAI